MKCGMGCGGLKVGARVFMTKGAERPNGWCGWMVGEGLKGIIVSKACVTIFEPLSLLLNPLFTAQPSRDNAL